MKYTYKHLLLALCATLFLFSCKKSDNPSSGGTSQSDLIVGKWYAVSLKTDKPYQWTSTVYGTDGFTYQSSCATGTYLSFTQGSPTSTGYALSYDACNVTTATLSYIIANGALTLDGNTRTIEQLDSKNLAFSWTVTVNGTPVKFTSGWQKQ